MMTDFISKIDIANKTITYKELKVKHLKIIYKCLFGDNPDPDIVLINFNNIIQNITNLSKKEIEHLDFISYFLLLFEIRSASIGNIIFAELPSSNTKLELNINKFSEQLQKLINEINLTTDSYSNVQIYYRYPSLKEITTFTTNQIAIENLYAYFIKSITINNQTVNVENLAIKDVITILEQLPAKVTSCAYKKSLEIIKSFNDVNLLSYIPGIKDINLIFNFNYKNLIQLLKLLFGDQLMSLYENIFSLCKAGNLTPEFIENCTPGEYLFFVKKLEALTSKQTTNPPLIEEESNMFDDLPPIVSRSEFTP